MTLYDKFIMKKKLLISLLFVFCLQLEVNAQFRQLRLANEELVKENFDKKKVLEKIEKYEKDNGIKPESKYIRSKYMRKVSDNIQTIDSAYTYFLEAFSGIESYDPKINEELCKDIILCQTNNTMENNEFESLLFSRYTKEYDLSTIESFLDKYPKNLFHNKAINVRDSLEFEKLKPLNDEFVLNEFLKKRPTSKFYYQAEDLMFTVAFNKAKESNSVEKYKNYIITYPNSPKLNDAIDFVSSKNWEEIENKNNKELYQKFVKDYPTSKFIGQANQKIEEIDWNSAIDSDSLTNFENFAANYPNSSKIELANSKIKEYKEIVLPYLTKNKKYNLLNIGTLKFIGDVEYDSMLALPKGKFIVSKYKKYGVIDNLANKIIPTTYDCIDNSGNFFIAKLGKNHGVLNDLGEKVIDFSFESITKTDNNNFIVTKNINNVNSTYGLISPKGEGILEAIYSSISEIDASTFNVTLNSQSFLVDLNGTVKSQKYTSIEPLSYLSATNLYYKVELKKKQGLINKNGEVVIPLSYESINEAGDYFIVSNTLPKLGTLYGIIDQKGKVLLDFKYKNIDHCGKSLFSINTNATPKSTVTNCKLYHLTSNSFLTKDSFDSIDKIENGLLQVQKNELIGYINELGETVVSPVYQTYYGEERGMSPDGYETEEEKCFVSSNFVENISSQEVYDKPELLLVQLGDKIGYINFKGEIIIPIIYNFGGYFYKGLTVVTDENEKTKIIDDKGEVILENAQILYYYDNSKYALARQENTFYKIDTQTHKAELYNLMKEMDYIDHYKKYKIITYKDMPVYVTYKDQVLMAKGIDFSDYNYNKKVNEARNLYYSAEYDKAISELKSLFNEKRDVYVVPLLLGRCYKEKGDTYSAVDYFNQAVAIDPNNTEAYYDRYQLNWNRNYWSDTKNDILKIMSLTAEYDESLMFNLGYCNANLNNDKEAFENYSKVIKNNPKYALAYNNRGAIYADRGDHQAALTDYMNALKNSKYETDEYKGLYLNNAANQLNKLNKKAEACVYWSKGAALGNADCIRNKKYNCK
jgi:tetratricopeptide (TPR) repeat protein